MKVCTYRLTSWNDLYFVVSDRLRLNDERKERHLMEAEKWTDIQFNNKWNLILHSWLYCELDDRNSCEKGSGHMSLLLMRCFQFCYLNFVSFSIPNQVSESINDVLSFVL